MHAPRHASGAVPRPLPAADPAPRPAIDLNLVTAAELHTGLLKVNLRAASVARALARGEASFKVHRSLRVAVQADGPGLLDELAHLELGEGHRINSDTVLLLDDGLFVTVDARPRSGGCTCDVRIWAASRCRAADAEASIIAAIGERRMDEPLMISIDWRFTTAKGEMRGAVIEEVATERLLDEAYPVIASGVSAFMRRFLDAPESVLVLQGPPGTGKSRLIRGILGELSRRRGGPGSVMFTTDERTLENDELFIDFLTGEFQALVVEDADLLLKARTSGNGLMHRFLNVADGIIRAQNRKMIFSTNLVNMRDIDEALVRPGRCFGHLALRDLTAGEAQALLARLCAGDEDRLARAGVLLAPGRPASVARVFAAHRETATAA